MKKLKIASLLLFVCFVSFGQTSVPNTDNFSLQDVYNVVHGHASGTSTNLQSCFDNSVPGYFNTTYSGSKNSLYNFRDYKPSSTCGLSVGDSYGGGTVVRLFTSGEPGYVAGECHGIIMSPRLSSNTPFGCVGVTITTSDIFLQGAVNTANILAACSDRPIAASICDDYTGGGFTDWWLPCSQEIPDQFLPSDGTRIWVSEQAPCRNGRWKTRFKNYFYSCEDRSSTTIATYAVRYF